MDLKCLAAQQYFFHSFYISTSSEKKDITNVAFSLPAISVVSIQRNLVFAVHPVKVLEKGDESKTVT